MYQQPVVIVKPPNSPPDRYERRLAEFTDQRVCTTGADAMQAIETAAARLVLIESDIDDMEALELAEMIRDVDDESSRFTYIIVIGETLTAEFATAFADTVDAFVSYDDIDNLPALAAAGARLTELVNDVIENNVQLESERKTLIAGQLLDPLTGLGNRQMAINTLEASIAQIESRGGAVCILLVSVENRSDIVRNHDEHIADELIQAIAERLDALVRPMDTVTYYDDGLFALILVQPSIAHCTAECFERIYDGVRLKAYRTSVGYLDAVIGMSICASHAEHGPPLPERMLRTARDGLMQAARQQQINITLLSED